nr:unnamed protein product [Digitaria exilis]
MQVLSDVLQRSNYDSEPMLMACGISIAKSFTEVDGRLKAGNGEDIFTRNGRWNFNNKKVEQPLDAFEENPSMRRAPPVRRVEDMFQQVETKLCELPKFLLCVLAERKNSDVYGPWKKKCLAEFGIVTQCVAPTRVNDQYLTNVLLKINAKLGGLNSLLQVETSPAMPLVSKVPTIILGMDVSHGSPGQSDVLSIAAGVPD